MGKRITDSEIIGVRFGRLVPIREAEPRRVKSGLPQRVWECQCDCGAIICLPQSNFRSGHTRSCGCLITDTVISRSYKHGHSRRENESPTFKCWMAMMTRCYCTTFVSYQRYGAVGIKVWEPWHDFATFLKDMGERPSTGHSLDRYPNQNGNYEPGNLRWATDTEQARNKRNNRLLTYKGETRCQSEWEEIKGFRHGLIKDRIRLGWSVERALETPTLKTWPRRSS